MRNAAAPTNGFFWIASPLLAMLFALYSYSYIYSWAQTAPLAFPAPKWLALAGGLYLLSHGLRALRLALIAASVAPLGVRKTVLLYFHAALASLILPLKLGDAYLVGVFGLLVGDWGKATLIAVVQRTFDAIALILLTLALSRLGAVFPDPYRVTLSILALVISGGFALIFIGGPGLLALQDYVFTHHVSRDARLVLRLICSLRQAIALGRACASRNFAALLALSLLTWLAEAGTVACLMPSNAQALSDFVHDFVGILTFRDGLPPNAYGVVVLTVIALTWPVATFLLLRGQKVAPVDAGRSALQGLSFAHRSKPRRIRLHMNSRSACSPD